MNSGNYVVRRQPHDGSKFPGEPSVLRRNILHSRSPECPFADDALPDAISFRRENNLKLLHEDRLSVSSFADVGKLVDYASIGFKPLVIGVAGCKAPDERTAGLPPVPAVFPPAEPRDLLDNGTLGGVVSNGLSRLEFDARGGLKVNGKPAAFVELEMKDGARPAPERVVLEYGKYLHIRLHLQKSTATQQTDWLLKVQWELQMLLKP